MRFCGTYDGIWGSGGFLGGTLMFGHPDLSVGAMGFEIVEPGVWAVCGKYDGICEIGVLLFGTRMLGHAELLVLAVGCETIGLEL